MANELPLHIGFIMDGNGRWATRQGLSRSEGHVAGANAFRRICEYGCDLGIKSMTFYAFSTENWSRPTDEVNTLMKLLRDYMKNCIKRANNNNMKVRVIGDKTALAEDIQESIRNLEEATSGNTGLKFTIAINYGSRDEIRRGVQSLAKQVAAGTLKPEEITEEKISASLDTAGYPDPDLMVRTSGEQRISNYLLWQCAYTEFYFTDIAWPEFDGDKLRQAIEAYSTRDRRFGNAK